MKTWTRVATFTVLWITLRTLAAFGAEEADSFTMRNSLDLLQYATATRVGETDFNPNNALLQSPTAQLDAQIRPNLKLLYGSQLTLTARPRLKLKLSESQVAQQWQSPQLTQEAYFNELHGSYQLSEAFQLTAGIQNYQWGPAELLNPSNRLFPEISLQYTPYYEFRGRALARINLTPIKSLSIVAAAEPFDVGAPTYYAGQTPGQKALLKSELNWNNGASYVGLAASGGQTQKYAVGEYAALTLSDAIQLYADVSHTMGSEAFYPTIQADGTTLMQQSKFEERRLYTLGIAGLRYTFEGGTELKLEYAYNQSGYTAQERTQALAALSNPANFAALARPGLSLPGQHYAYASLRITDFGPKNRFTGFARYLLSATDFSGTAFGELDWAVTDSTVLYALAAVPHGGRNSELNSTSGSFFIFGHKTTY